MRGHTSDMLRKCLALIFWLISVLITCLVVAKAAERRKVLSVLTAPEYSWCGGDIKAAGLHDH